jgi:hypothetical protein
MSVHNFVHKDGCPYVETSAFLGKNVEDAFKELMFSIDLHKLKTQSAKKVKFNYFKQCRPPCLINYLKKGPFLIPFLLCLKNKIFIFLL